MAMTPEAILVPASRRPQMDGELGKNISKATSWEEAVQIADLDWEIVEKPMYYRFGQSYKRAEDRKATTRSDNGLIVGDVGVNYQPINNSAIGGFLTPLVKDGAATFLTAGEALGGSICYATLQLGEDITLNIGSDGKEEDYSPRLAVIWSHDGSRALRESLIVMRKVCTNGLTLPVAVRHLSIRHSGDVEKKIAVAQATTHLWVNYRDRFEKAAGKLIDRKMTLEEIQKFTQELFPSKKEQVDGGEAAKQTQERRDALLAVLRKAPDLAGMRDTGWGVLNATVEFFDHVAPYGDGRRKNAEERRFLSIVDGNTADMKDRAYQLLTGLRS